MAEQSGASVKYPVLEIDGRLRYRFEWGQRTYLMGIINLTPDSFSGDGLLAAAQAKGASTVELALVQGRAFAAAGVDILDVGAESTRPGAQAIGAAEELERLIPVIEALRGEVPALISVDTYKGEVAEAALAAGAQMVNDVWGLRADVRVGEAAARYGAAVVVMHNRSSWAQAEVRERLGGRYVDAPYQDLLGEVCAELMESVQLAQQAGVAEERIIVDPGIGFGKTVAQNLELVNRLGEVRSRLGYPLLAGPSRKSFIGYTLDVPPEERLAGSAAAAAVCIMRGADILRVHDVAFMAQLARMTDAITRAPIVPIVD